MSNKVELDKTGLIGKLPVLEYEEEEHGEDQIFEQMSIAKSVLKLAEIDHDKQYSLSRALADRLLESVPEF